MRYQNFNIRIPVPDLNGLRRLKAWLPSRGNVLFTLLIVGALMWAQTVGAFPSRAPSAASTSTGSVAYQGRLANASGTPLTGAYSMVFRLYNAASGSAPLWTENWTGSNSVQVNDGLFNVMLGSLTPISQTIVTGNSSLWLGITVGTDNEMSPRVQLGSVPWAMGTSTLLDGAKALGSLDVNGTLSVKADVPARIETTNSANITVLELRHPDVNWHFHVDVNDHPEIGFYDVSAQQFRWNVLDFDKNTGNVGVGSDALPTNRLTVYGNLSATGTKAATVQAGNFGARKLYAIESPDVRFSDEGLATLTDGVARVSLDPIFLETIEGQYLVHVTPYGNASLYVAEVGEDHFVVKARDGDPNVSFAWRLSATRKGYAGVRLEKVEKQ